VVVSSFESGGGGCREEQELWSQGESCVGPPLGEIKRRPERRKHVSHKADLENALEGEGKKQHIDRYRHLQAGARYEIYRSASWKKVRVKRGSLIAAGLSRCLPSK